MMWAQLVPNIMMSVFVDYKENSWNAMKYGLFYAKQKNVATAKAAGILNKIRFRNLM